MLLHARLVVWLDRIHSFSSDISDSAFSAFDGMILVPLDTDAPPEMYDASRFEYPFTLYVLGFFLALSAQAKKLFFGIRLF